MNFDRMYCVSTWANVRKKPDMDSELLYTLHYGESVEVGIKETVMNGKRRVILRRKMTNDGNEKLTYCVGWVPDKALTFECILDVGRLLYENNTGKHVPVCDRYKGKVTGYILPGEKVEVFSRVGNWAKTRKGWTKWGWLTRRKGIYDDEGAVTLSLMIAGRAVQDYKVAVKRLMKDKFKKPSLYCNTYSEVMKIQKYFASDWYKANFDPVPGLERLQGLNEAIGFTEERQKEVRDKYIEYKASRWVRKRDEA